ncbi:MAG: dTDP-4-dehydrorhamnose reductase, partial [Flavobacteriales bacterium]
MKRVLLTGSNGLLGQKLMDLYLGIDDIELIATARGDNRYPRREGYTYATLDITNEKEVQSVIAKYAPDCIINTAAMTNVD